GRRCRDSGPSRFRATPDRARQRIPPAHARRGRRASMRQDGVDLAGDLGESRLVVHRQIGKHLAIDRDLRLLQPRHERAVAHAELAHRRVDARDPQRAEGAFLVPAVAVGVLARLHHRLLGYAVDILAAAAETLGLLENLLVARARRDSTLDSWHGALPTTSTAASRGWRPCWSGPRRCCGASGASAWWTSWS